MDRFTYKKQTMKAEELKQTRYIGVAMNGEKLYTFNEEDLEQYAAEVSREMAAKFACEMNFNERADFRELPEEYYDDYDNWIKQQEEKK